MIGHVCNPADFTSYWSQTWSIFELSGMYSIRCFVWKLFLGLCTQLAQFLSPLSYFIALIHIATAFPKKSFLRFQMIWCISTERFKPKDHIHLRTFYHRCRSLIGLSNLPHTTVAARCWRRHSEASWERRTREQTKRRCNLPNGTNKPYCWLRQLEPRSCFARQLGWQQCQHDLHYNPSSCNFFCYRIPFPCGARAWRRSRRCFDCTKNDRTGSLGLRSKLGICWASPSGDSYLLKLPLTTARWPSWRSKGTWTTWSRFITWLGSETDEKWENCQTYRNYFSEVNLRLNCIYSIDNDILYTKVA